MAHWFLSLITMNTSSSSFARRAFMLLMMFAATTQSAQAGCICTEDLILAPPPPPPPMSPDIPPSKYTSSGPPYGVCRDIHDEAKQFSHWCRRGGIPGEPSRPDLNYGRQTIFNGPVGMQKGWCGQILHGTPDYAAVAVSTKYIDLKGESPHSPTCEKCMCIRIRGADETSNPYPDPNANAVYGKILKGKVLDRCAECEDDHIDILADIPYTDAPVNEWNPKASEANAVQGDRAMTSQMAYSVGVWTAEWQFVDDCNVDCNAFFQKQNDNSTNVGGRRMMMASSKVN